MCVCGCAVCGCVVCVVWVAHISIVKTKKLRFFRIYDQVHLVRSDQVHLVMTRYTWSDDQVPGHIYPGKYPGAQVTRYPGTQVPRSRSRNRYPGTRKKS